MMKRWREQDKKMVVESLSEKADGMFRWVFCQLEALRQCLPQSVRRTLHELPESLDETYERVMKEIKRANQAQAYRMLQCLAVAVRPLSVTELAELLAFDFDVANGEIPKLNSNWRWDDHEQAVLSTCSSLITVVPGHAGSSRSIVQFSHFSVKEFLMSDRLATSSTRDISQYHISLEDAHTVLLQASLGVLLWDDVINGASAPLVSYASTRWAIHAQVENVASRVRAGMERLFDPAKPYFDRWVPSIDLDRDTFGNSAPNQELGARQSYFAALCGFHEVVDHLTLKYPHSASARGGLYGTALHAASFAGHLQIVRLLLRRGVDVDTREYANGTPLRCASQSGHRDVVQYLIDRGADVNLKGSDHKTPLNWAACGGHVDVVRVLLEHNSDVHSQDHHGRSPLHDAIWGEEPRGDYTQVVRLLLEHGANVNALDARHRNPLHLLPMSPKKLDILRILLEHGADIDAEDDEGRTPFEASLEGGHEEVTRLLSGNSSRRAQT